MSISCLRFAAVCSLCCIHIGCMSTIVVNKAARSLSGSGGGTVFTGDDDPELIAQALPFALKTYESLLEKTPRNSGLLIATGRGFCTYAYAFVQAPADTLPDSRIQEKTAQQLRAKRMYLRAKSYLMRALDVRHPGFSRLVEAGKIDSAIALATQADTTLLYWAGNAWMGAFTADKFDMSLAIDMSKPVAFMQRVLDLNGSYGQGAVHDFFISYYGSIPQSMGGSEEKARMHYAKALELSGGVRAAPHVSLATSVCVGKQNRREFAGLLNTALAVRLDASPGNRLANILSQRKAQWLLEHIDDFFLDTEETTGQEGSQ